MGKSAHLLGEVLLITAEEMNELLKLNGFLEGVPGDYQVTEEGKPYATERYEHRGPGGYSQYNRDWTIRTWDDSVLNAIDTSPEMIQEARDNVSERRRARYRNDDEPDTDIDEQLEEDDSDDLDDYAPMDVGTVVKGVAIIAAVAGAIIAVPHIKKFYKEKVKPACKRAWCKITKSPFEPMEIEESSDEQPTGLQGPNGNDGKEGE